MPIILWSQSTLETTEKLFEMVESASVTFGAIGASGKPVDSEVWHVNHISVMSSCNFEGFRVLQCFCPIVDV